MHGGFWSFRWIAWFPVATARYRARDGPWLAGLRL